jgi:hypothetical protein
MSILPANWRHLNKVCLTVHGFHHATKMLTDAHRIQAHPVGKKKNARNERGFLSSTCVRRN